MKRICASSIDTSMHSMFNFQELHQEYWGVIRLLNFFYDYKLKWAVMGVHGHGGLFLFWNLILDE
jgi:hypothetical protein